jgi:phosphoribosyl-dephospho-CoA transferase
MIALWLDKGWPLSARRAAQGDVTGVPVGLPLPPCAGKRRLSFVVQPGNIVDIRPPPALRRLIGIAPPPWRATLDSLDSLAAHEFVDVRVCGGLMWQTITGLEYLTASSDLDILLRVNQDTDLELLADRVARIDAAAPMRIDGEFIRADGAAVNWREFHEQSSEVLVKTLDGVALVEPKVFAAGCGPS